MGNGKPPGAGRGENVHTVLGLHAQRPETGADLVHQRLVLGEADVVVAAELKVVPLLVHRRLLAVDHLLDLLDFLVHPDQTSVAQRLCVAKLFRTPS